MSPRNQRLIFLGLFALSAGLMLRLALRSRFATDEYTYAHAAWAVAQGQQPFRDFFFHHFPLSVQLGSLVFLGSDDPGTMLALRWLMVPVWLGTLWLVGRANRAHDAWAWALSAPVLASFWSWDMATQFRPDPFAICLFLSSVLLATHQSTDARRARLVGFMAGVALVLAVWASQKVVIYGGALPVAWLVAMRRARRVPTEPRGIREPGWMAAGALLGATSIALYLTVTSNWGPLYEWCWKWGIVHEEHYPTRSKLKSLAETFGHNGYLLAFGLLGLWSTLQRLRRSWGTTPHTREVVLLASTGTTIGSYFMQRAPFEWSLVAPLTLIALYAARGLSSIIERLAPVQQASFRRALVIGACVALAAWQLPYGRRTHRKSTDPRRFQERMLAHVAAFTAPGEPVYDNTGFQVARPHCHFFYFTDKAARVVLADTLATEIPRAILASGVTVHIADRRDTKLPEPLRAFLNEHFVRVVDRMRIWGRRFETLGANGPETFEAVRDARYYVTPASPGLLAHLTLDGQPLRASVSHLRKGAHRVAWTGKGQAPAFALVWLPRDGRQRAPLPELGPIK